ncbi:MAG: ligand-binding sensor domain-containing protein [Owenweeksia sp.]
MFKLRILIALSISVSLQAQQYHFSNLSLPDGLPQSQVLDICEDKGGYIWMATNGGGLARFDGLEFSTFTSTKGLPSPYIRCLLEDRKGTLWVGSAKGLLYKTGATFHDFILPEKDLSIGRVHEDSQGHLWLGTNKGVYVIRDSLTKAFYPEKLRDHTINFIQSAPDSSVWIGTDNGIFIFRNDSLSILNTSKGLTNRLTQCMVSDTRGRVWIGNYGRGFDLITTNGIYNMGPLCELDRSAVLDIFCDEDGLVWIATQEKGICRFNPADSSYVFLTEGDGLANNHVRSILHDRWGNYWFGTSGGGVSKYSGQQFERYGRESGLPGSYIYAIAADHQNNLWVSTSGGGIARQQDKGFVPYNTDSGFTNEKVRALFVDSDSLLWIGTDGQGLAVWNGDTFHFFDVNNGLAGNWVKSIREDSKGRIWAASAGGGISLIAKTDSLDSLKIIKYTTRTGLKGNRVIHLHIDQKDRVWFASQTAGIGYIENDSTIRHFTTAEGLASSDVRSLAEDSLGTLWIGSTAGLNAIRLYQSDLKVRETSSDALFSRNIYQLTAQGNQLWVGTEKGLDRLTVDSSLSVLESAHFGADEGFSGVETNLNAAHQDRNGNLWFGTVNGLHRFLSQGDKTNTIPPILNFSTISLNYTPLENTVHNSGNPAFEYDENHLSFDFLGITQTLPKKVQYRWRLTGLEEEWSPPSNRNSVTYSNLPPGNYRFEVLSGNEDGIWNNEPIIFSFSIKTPFWKTTWFIILAILSGLLLISTIVISRIRTLKRKAAENQQRLRMERDLISLEQKALRLQMNPHFIFHTLNSIQALIATKDEPTARIYLSRFSKLMRQILENSRSNEISLETEIDTMQNYLSIERFCHDEKFDYSIELNEELETAFIRIPPMILQPFVENAIIHGIGSLESQGYIKLHFTEEDQAMICTITDNGVGREQAAENRGKDHQSTALKVTEERLNLLNGSPNSIVIQDLKNDDGSAAGTRVTVKLPILN